MSQPFEYIGTELGVFASAARWKRYFEAQLRPFIKGDVLEVGAGIGGTTTVLCRGGIKSWTCLEPDAVLASRLRSTLSRESLLAALPIQVKTGALASIPADTRFDSILYIDVLEHIEDDHSELHRASQHLAPRGHLIVLSPAHSFLFSPFDRAIGHFRRYSRASLRQAAPSQLELVCLRYLDSVGMLASLTNRAFLRSSHPTNSQIYFWDRFMVPLSRVIDPMLQYRVGKSILGVWRSADTNAERVNH